MLNQRFPKGSRRGLTVTMAENIISSYTSRRRGGLHITSHQGARWVYDLREYEATARTLVNIVYRNNRIFSIVVLRLVLLCFLPSGFPEEMREASESMVLSATSRFMG